MAIRSNGKALELGAGCLISETFVYLSGVINLIGRCLIGITVVRKVYGSNLLIDIVI